MFCTLYITLGHLNVEYSSEIWNPHLIGDKQILEKVQRRATKLVPKLKQLSYIAKTTFLYSTDRLVALSLPSLCTDDQFLK